MSSLLTDIGLAIEADCERDELSVSLLRAITEYLSFDESERNPETDEKSEQFLQLQFLYANKLSNQSFEDSFDEDFESDELMAARHAQLLRGLKLAHKYEHSLVKMIDRAENNEVNDLYDLGKADFSNIIYNLVIR